MSRFSNALRALTDPRYRYLYWHRRIENRQRRAALAARRAAKLPSRPPGEPSELAGKLRNSGFAMVDDLLDADRVASMRNYFAAFEVTSPYDPALGRFRAPDGAPEGVHVAYFDADVCLNAPHALEIANDQRVLDAVTQFLGCAPMISYMQAWWSMPTEGAAKHAENFHRDFDDLKFCKLFVYLTDVDEGAGPHLFIAGSQNVSRLEKRRRYQDEEVAAVFTDPTDWIRFTGTAGTAFLEDTSGLHKGTPPQTSPRLIFQVIYSLEQYYGGPRRPIRGARSEERRFDPYSNSAYLAF